jgi:hypothetical protein
MPLLRSDSAKAFTHNIKAEMHAGKPQDQALAIAYSIKRKKHSAGGEIEESEHPVPHHMHPIVAGIMAKHMDEGGDVGEPLEHGLSEKLGEGWADGGEVDYSGHTVKEHHNEDFMSAEHDGQGEISMYPHGGEVENDIEPMNPKDKIKSHLHKIFRELHK